MKSSELAPWGVDAAPEPIGDRGARVDAFEKVRGAAQYSADVQLSGQLTAVIVRSTLPHARILGIDTDAALAIPGVVAILGPDDVDDVSWYDEETPFFGDIVRFVGDEICALIAESAESARAGAAAVAVDAEPLPFVTDPEAALAEDAPLIHPDNDAAPGNLVDEPTIQQRGDAARAMAGAAVVIEAEYRTNAAIHNALEPHGAVAHWSNGSVTVFASTQGVNDVREAIADRLGLDHNHVRVVAEHIGGGFGAKQVPWKPTMTAVLASRAVGRPVRCMNDRRAENLAAGKRNATVQHVRLGADSEGRLVAIEADLLADVGAYRVAGEASDLSGPYLHLYACDHVRTTTRRVYTNTGPAVAFRAPGYVEATFALESAMDELAREIGVDPIELRLRNYTEHDQEAGLPWSSPSALRVSYERVRDASDWGGRPSESGVPGILTGRGFAAHEWLAASAQPPGHAWGELNTDGSIHITTSTQDIGTGTRTALLQVAAAEFGTTPERIRLSMGDTAVGPPAPASAGSTTIPTMAPAVRAVTAELRHGVIAAAARHLQVAEDGLRFDGDIVTGPDIDDLSLADLLEAIAPEGIHAVGSRLDTPDDVSVRTFGSAVADVEVDTATGEVRVTQVVVAPDCGRILNRRLVDSQVIGGVAQGIGFALTEEQIVDHVHGMVVNGDLEDYLIPTVADTCPVIHAEIDLPDLAANPLGSKGVGELPLIPVPAAIANAVADAIGVRLRELPLTRRRVLAALAETVSERNDT